MHNTNLPIPPRESDDPIDIDLGMYGVLPDFNPTVDPQLTAGRRIQQLLIRSYFNR